MANRPNLNMGSKNDRKRFRPATFSSDSEDEKISVFDKFFVISSLEQDKTFKNTSPFLIEKSVFAAIGNTKNVKKLRDGNLLVEILREKQGKNILKLDTFCDLRCQVSPHRTLNTSKGIIRDRRLYCCSEDEIKEGLAKQGVTNVRRIQIRKNNEMVKTNSLILTFNNPTRPEKLEIFFQIVPVLPYIPNPLRCFQCQKFGHHENNCKNTLICGHCAGLGNHHEGSCNKPAKCANCGDPHPSNSNKCPVWQKEKEVTKLKFTNNISYPEARRLVENRPAQTFSAIVQSSYKQTKDAQTQTSNACTQTEFTDTVSAGVADDLSAIADGMSAPADKLPVPAGKLSAPADKPSAPADGPSAPADKLSAPADKPSAAAGTASTQGTGIPVKNGKPVTKGNGQPAGQQRKSAARPGQATCPSKKGTNQDPLKTGNRFAVLKDGAREGMDCESSPSAHGSRQSSHSPILPLNKRLQCFETLWLIV